MSDSNDTLIINETMETTPGSVSNDTVQSTNENVDEAKPSVEAKTSKTPIPEDDSSTAAEPTPPGEPVDPENLVFNRANVESLGNHVHLVDSDEENKLDMFCYVKCDERDNELLKQCRGVVFNGDDIVMKAFPYTYEFDHTDLKGIDSALGDFKNVTFYEAHEGALVRLFNFNGKWFVSTHRKLNAFRSKWASRVSFGTSFKNALTAEEESNKVFKDALPEGDNILERFQSTLDTDKQYMFLIRNTKDNRIVCSAPDRPTVYHVGTFVDGKLVFTEDIKIPVPKKLTFLNVNDIGEYIDTISYMDRQGVIGFTDDNRQIKVIHKDYQDLFRARGNEPSIKFRYLQVRMNRNFVNMLYHLYPDMVETFEEYENTLYDIGRSIYNAYVQRFIKKSYVTVPREEFAVISECHSWHLKDRTGNRISLNQVIRVMNKQSPTHLNHMIRRFKLEETNHMVQKNHTRPQSNSGHSTKSFEKSPAVRKINQLPVPMSPLRLSNNSPLDIGGAPRDKTQQKNATISQRKPLYVPKKHE
jgi:hypothetical protein